MQAVSLKFKPTALAAALLLGSLNANAALTSYTNDGVDLVYSSVSDVTWTKDGNLLATLFATQGFNTMVNAISSASSGKFYGTSWPRFITPSEFSMIDGTATWYGAMAYVNYLNSINYGGSNQWYLPTVANTTFGVDTSTNGTAKGDELSELFYAELGVTAGKSIPNTATFDNEQAYHYWSGTEYHPVNLYAWNFSTVSGYQNVYYKYEFFYAWAVSPGMVSSIPEADTTGMLLAGLGVMGAVLRRRHAG